MFRIRLLLSLAALAALVFFLRSTRQSGSTSTASARATDSSGLPVALPERREVPTQDRASAPPAASAAAIAEAKAAWRADFAERDRFFRELAAKATVGFQSHSQKFKLLSGLQAVNANAAHGALPPMSARTAANRGGLKFIAVGSAGPAPGAMPVVWNESRQQAGALTGNIQVQLQDWNALDAVAETNQLRVVQAFPGLQRAYLAPAQVSAQTVLKAYSALAQDPRVAAANMEIQYHRAVVHSAAPIGGRP